MNDGQSVSYKSMESFFLILNAGRHLGVSGLSPGESFLL